MQGIGQHFAKSPSCSRYFELQQQKESQNPPPSKNKVNQPKGAPSAYVNYMRATSATVRLENHGISFAEVGNLLAANWKVMSISEKSKFEATAAEVATLQDGSEPKGAPATYANYMRATSATVRQENPDASFAEVGQLLASKWRTMSIKEKSQFEVTAAKEPNPQDGSPSNCILQQPPTFNSTPPVIQTLHQDHDDGIFLPEEQ